VEVALDEPEGVDSDCLYTHITHVRGCE
jgi:hypothetical protein